MDDWQLYVTVGLVLVALEIVVPGFILAPIGIAALVTGCAAFLGAGPLLQALAFALTAGALFIALRFWNKSRFARPVSGGDFGPIGQVGEVIVASESAARPGRVKVFSDEFEILPTDEVPTSRERYSVGDRVRVARVVGNKVVVQRILNGKENES